MMPFFLWLNYMGWFRSDSLEELVGLDLSYMGNNTNAAIQSQDMGDGFSDAGGDDATSFDGASVMKKNTRSFTNMSDHDEASWTDMTNAQKEQPKRSRK